MGGAVQCSLGLAQTPGHFATLERTGGQDGAAALEGVQSRVMESKDLVSGLGDATLGADASLKRTPELWPGVHHQFGGYTETRASSGITPITTAILSSQSGNFIFPTIQERDRGSSLEQLINNFFSTTWLKVELVGQKPVQLDKQPSGDVLASSSWP